MHFSKSILAAALTISTTAYAEQEFRQHDAHVHGHVVFHIAQDTDLLLVEIEAPGADIVGFEHAPENDAQGDALTKALALLNKPEQLLKPSDKASCAIAEVRVSHSLGEEETGHHDDEHHDEHHDDEHHDDKHHDEHHDDEHHDDKHHDEHHDDEHHDDEHHDEGGHGSFHIEYQFICQEITKLEQIDTAWFKHFPNTKEIDVNIITDKTQASLELNSSEHVIKL